MLYCQDHAVNRVKKRLTLSCRLYSASIACCCIGLPSQAERSRSVSAQVVVEGANGPTTREADAILNDRGIPVLPDILANSGGVIASYIEWRKSKSGSLTSREETFALVDELVLAAFRRVVDFAQDKKTTLRGAARVLAVQEVVETMIDRGWI